MHQIVTIILPVFALIAIGYAAAHIGLLKDTAEEGLADYVYVIAIPLLLFRILTEGNFAEARPWTLWSAYFIGVAFSWILGTLVIRVGFGRDARAGAIGGIAASFANTVLVGIPVISAAYGEAGLVPLSLIISVHMPLMAVAITLAMERAAVADGVADSAPLADTLRAVLKNLMTNPIIVAILFAAVWRLIGIPISGVIGTIIEKIAATAAPLALISLGLSLKNHGVRGNIMPALWITVIKLAAMPLMVWLITEHVFGLPAHWVAAAVVCSACPAGVNTFVFASRFGVGQAIAANSITFSTALSAVTIAIFLAVFGAP